MDNYKYTPDSSLKNLLINIKQPESHITIGNSNQKIWAHIDKDMQVTHLDMELCAQGPHNMYTALAMAIWNKAVQEEREACAKLCEAADKSTHPADLADAIRARGNKT
jgi:hypothetical protein